MINSILKLDWKHTSLLILLIWLPNSRCVEEIAPMVVTYFMYYVVFSDLWCTIFLFRLFEIALHVWYFVMWFELICVILCIVLSVTVCYTTVTYFMFDCLVTAFWIYEMNEWMNECILYLYVRVCASAHVHVCCHKI